jgi:hypothetical protein
MGILMSRATLTYRSAQNKILPIISVQRILMSVGVVVGGVGVQCEMARWT